MFRAKGWRRRSTTFLRVLSVLVAAFLFVLVFAAVIQTMLSADRHPKLAIVIGSNYVSWLVIGLLAILLSKILRHNDLSLPVPAMFASIGTGDLRARVFSRGTLAVQFEAGDGCHVYSEDGWELRGNGISEVTSVTYRGRLGECLSIAAQFKAIIGQRAEEYWRAGYVLTADGRELGCFHIDSDSLIVGRLEGAREIRVVAVDTVQNRWNYLELQVGRKWGAPELHFFGHYAGQSFFLGVIPLIAGIQLHVRAWSDKEKHHVVRVRDVTVTTARA